MNLKEWAARSSRRGRLSDSSLLSGSVIGDSEKSKFVSVWTDSSVLSTWSKSKKRLNRL